MSIFLCKVKTEQECPATKKRKTEWLNGLKNMPGETLVKLQSPFRKGFPQDVLSYLGMFVEPAGGAGTSATTAHPVDLVLDSFKTAEAAKATTEKLQNFWKMP